MVIMVAINFFCSVPCELKRACNSFNWDVQALLLSSGFAICFLLIYVSETSCIKVSKNFACTTHNTHNVGGKINPKKYNRQLNKQCCYSLLLFYSADSRPPPHVITAPLLSNLCKELSPHSMLVSRARQDVTRILDLAQLMACNC